MSHDVLSRHNQELPINRRTVLVLLGLGAVAALKSDMDHTHHHSRITAYLPTWLADEKYETIRQNIEPRKAAIDRMHLAFAHFDTTSGVVSGPPLSSELHSLVNDAAPTTDLSLSVGGGNADESFWLAAWSNRLKFAKSIDDSRRGLEDIFQRPVHIDIDCERNISAVMVTELAKAVRASMSDSRDLSMAVPADHRLDTFDARPTQLGDVVDTYRVMTYDQHGPWSGTAGAIASGMWTVAAMHRWVQKVGDPAKLEVGYPTYGYKYPGAVKAGDTFDAGGTSVLYSNLPKTAVRDDIEGLTSEALVNDNTWASCLSPRIIGAVAMKLQADYPDLGGSFFWSMDGLGSAHLDAVTIRD